MATNIAEMIVARTDDLPPGERKAAQALMANYPMLGLKTVAEFSARAGVSSPTILRFVSRIGFQNYAEFQGALNDELAARLESPLSRTGVKTRSVAGSDDPFAAAILDNVSETFKLLAPRQIADAIALLADPRLRIHLVGGRFTDPIARYLGAHLQIIRPGVFHLEGQENMWRDRLLDMGRKDVLVVFDIRRYQESLLHFAGKAKARGVTIVLMTDQWLSPIARFTNHVVAARTAVPSAWDSSAALFVVAERLIAGVTDMLPDQSAARIRDMDALREE
ncbi:MAG: MurR/RpiR family transcriptional regulator [Mesorhizobium sp.]